MNLFCSVNVFLKEIEKFSAELEGTIFPAEGQKSLSKKRAAKSGDSIFIGQPQKENFLRIFCEARVRLLGGTQSAFRQVNF